MDWSTGTPDLSAWAGPNMQQLLALLRANPDKLALGLHEYSLEENVLESPWLVGRWKKIPGIAGVTILFTEFGWAERHCPPPAVGIPQLIDQYRQHYAYPEVQGLALWTLDKSWGDLELMLHPYIAELTKVIPATEIQMKQLVTAPPSAVILEGPDVSKWQGPISFPTMYNRGAKLVYIRGSYATYSGIWDDERVAINAPAALVVPFRGVGPYHYYYPSQGPEAQAAKVLSVWDRWKWTAVPAIDLEEGANVPSNIADRVKLHLDLVTLGLKNRGITRPLAIYTSPYYWFSVLGAPDWGKLYTLWLAQWTSAPYPSLPKPWTDYGLWQYTVIRDAAEARSWGVSSSSLDMNRTTEQRFQIMTTTPSLQNKYKAIVCLVHPMASPEQAVAIYNHNYNQARRTVASSVDDAVAVVTGDNALPASEIWVYSGRNLAGKWAVFSAAEMEIIKQYPHVMKGLPQPPKPPPPPPPPSADKYHIWTAFTTPTGANGPYLVLHTDEGPFAGATENTQLQPKNKRIVKGGNYERVWVDGGYIVRWEDTSHSNDRYYTLADPVTGKPHRWLPSEMEIGVPFERTAKVSIYKKAGCQHEVSYTESTTARLTKVHLNIVLAGRALPRVYEIEVTKDGAFVERYWFAEGVGLVQWWSASGSHSVVGEWPQGRGDLEPNKIDCIGGA
jgi:lysozyme